MVKALLVLVLKLWLSEAKGLSTYPHVLVAEPLLYLLKSDFNNHLHPYREWKLDWDVDSASHRHWNTNSAPWLDSNWILLQT